VSAGLFAKQNTGYSPNAENQNGDIQAGLVNPIPLTGRQRRQDFDCTRSLSVNLKKTKKFLAF